jgi:hypothetical protein
MDTNLGIGRGDMLLGRQVQRPHDPRRPELNRRGKHEQRNEKYANWHRQNPLIDCMRAALHGP